MRSVRLRRLKPLEVDPIVPFLVVKTRAQHEAIVQRKLRCQGVTTYLPKYFDEKTRCRRVLFASYLFVRRRPNMDCLWDRSIPQIRYVLNIGREASRQLDDFVRQLKKRTKFGLVQFEKPPAPKPLKPGDKVTLKGYKDLEDKPLTGIYEGQSSDERVAVLLGNLRVTAAIEDVQAA